MFSSEATQTSTETALPVSSKATPLSVGAKARAANPSVTGSTASKLKNASKAASSAIAAKKQAAAPAGKREQATYELTGAPRGKFVRVHPAEEYRLHNVPVLEDPDTQELYFVEDAVELPEFIAAQVRRIHIYAAQTHDFSAFLWRVKVSETNWYKAARRAVNAALTRWVQVQARKAANTYDLITPFDAIPDPDWSSFPAFDEMIEIAFEGHMIASMDHPLLRKLQGINDDDDCI